MSFTSKTVSVSLALQVHAALNREAVSKQMSLTDVCQRAIEKHAIASGFLEEQQASEIQLMQELVDAVRLRAQEMCRKGDFKPSLTLDVLNACQQDADWLERYRKIVGSEIYANGNTAKANLNQNLGYWIKRSVDAKNAVGPGGKPLNMKVAQPNIIQSYTPFADFDRQGVWMTPDKQF